MLTSKKLLPPPWIAYPYISRYSIGWRMGYGEGYIDEWGKWYGSLEENQQKEYRSLFPEPITWKGYWKKEHTGICYVKNDFVLELWREEGECKYSVETLRKLHNTGEKRNYIMFWKPTISEDGSITESCLSQWWKSDFSSEINTYCCMEQYMMSQKAELFADEEIQKKIMDLGRKVHNFDKEVWDKAKYSIVLNGNYLKFAQNQELRKFLLGTGDAILVEASPLDAIWGIRMSSDNENATDPTKWHGSNLLGFALMEVRDEIRKVWANVDLCEMSIVE